MLRKISPIISPDLLSVLHRMGHGDEIVLADAYFPGESLNPRVLRADGHGIAALLEGIMPLFTPDQYVENPLVMMAPVPGDVLDPSVEEAYLAAIRNTWPTIPPVERMERYAFYDRARSAFAIVLSGETAIYGNIILKKGVTME